MLVDKKIVFTIIQFISISRALSGLLFVCIALRNELIIFSSILYIYACISDFIDGFLARKYSCTSPPGQILDLFGDKFLTVASVLYAIARSMPIIPLSIIAFREIFLLSIRGLNTNEICIFKPQRTLGGITVLPIWLTTLLLLQYPQNIDINKIIFLLLYWMCGVLALGNLIYKLTRDWKLLISIFKKHI